MNGTTETLLESNAMDNITVRVETLNVTSTMKDKFWKEIENQQNTTNLGTQCSKQDCGGCCTATGSSNIN